jgi:beta-aspartyl-peptidase (threonine type)
MRFRRVRRMSGIANADPKVMAAAGMFEQKSAGARMLRIFIIFISVTLLTSCAAKPEWVLAIHGGAGGVPKDLPPAEIQRIKDTLRKALDTGSRILASGGTSVAAVESAVRVMEDSGVLNAGRGAVLNHKGFAELDAAIMDGRDKKAGAVAALRHIANPIDLARLVMDRSPHVLMVAQGAEEFAQEQGVALQPQSYFITERRRNELEKEIESQKKPLTKNSLPWHPVGTVGAVALDEKGNLAAATSTGGLTNKHFGRVGDSPIIGAGTYAENGVCAISATGAGEVFIRYAAAAETCARVRYRKDSIESASKAVILELKAAGGEGGMIAMDANGHVAMPYSSQTMLRGEVSSKSAARVVVATVGP